VQSKLTGTAEYISPEDNKRVVDHLLRVNAELHDRLLTEHEWYVDKKVYEKIRKDNEDLLLWILKRTSQFAVFRAQKSQETIKGGKKPSLVVPTEEDLNNAWDTIQMDRQNEKRE
jgi:hypothetical protein